MKALVGAFNQEKALVGAGLLRDCTTSPINRFAALVARVKHQDPGILTRIMFDRAAGRQTPARKSDIRF